VCERNSQEVKTFNDNQDGGKKKQKKLLIDTLRFGYKAVEKRIPAKEEGGFKKTFERTHSSVEKRG